MKLSNNNIAIEVAEHGAELTSLQKKGCEYLWTGDAAFWNRHAPILFPAVGKPYNNELHAEGKTFPMKQHGYARDSQFECGNVEMSECGSGRTSATFALTQPSIDAITRSGIYPYRLGLKVCYQIKDSTVEATWTVKNLDNKEAFFQIGAHPGFLLPDYNPADAVHGFVHYYDRNSLSVSPVIVHGLEDGNRVPLADGAVRIPSEMPITADTFTHDALMFENSQVTRALLCDKEGNKVLSVSCPQAEAYGIWAPHKEGCPFVCLEPWCGICDPKGFAGDISTRQYIHRLSPRECYTFTYTIEVY